jgi:hypothetical protein
VTAGPADPLAALAARPEVAEATGLARDEVDALLWERGLRTHGATLAAESVLRGARDSAAIDGADVRLDAIRSGAALDGSPMGAVAAAALRVTRDVPGLLPAWRRSPLQAVASLHLAAARDLSPESDLGRPRTTAAPDDPLRIGPPPPAAEIGARLDALARTLSAPTAAPAIVVAGVAHGELLALRPFAWGSGLVARATVRLVLAERGVDPDLVTVPEAGMLAQGRPSYVTALRAYASGTPDGVASWLVWNAGAVALGARQARALLADLG